MAMKLRRMLVSGLLLFAAGCGDEPAEPTVSYPDLLRDVSISLEQMIAGNWALSERLAEVEKLRKSAEGISYEYGSEQRLNTCQPYELESKLGAVERLLSTMIRSDELKVETAFAALDSELAEISMYATDCEEVVHGSVKRP